MKNIRSLEKLLPEGGAWDEDLTDQGGAIYVYAPKWKAWADTGTNSLVYEWYSFKPWNQTRAMAIESLIEDMQGGIDEATEDTIHCMGWEEGED